jgi:hypothetical protein
MKSATSGHTTSLAGDYMVCESCVRQPSGIVDHTFSQFEDLLIEQLTGSPHSWYHIYVHAPKQGRRKEELPPPRAVAKTCLNRL